MNTQNFIADKDATFEITIPYLKGISISFSLYDELNNNVLNRDFVEIPEIDPIYDGFHSFYKVKLTVAELQGFYTKFINMYNYKIFYFIDDEPYLLQQGQIQIK